jgi:hypothetical protein
LKKNLQLFFGSILPLFFGGMIYLLFRVESLKMFLWLGHFGMKSLVHNGRIQFAGVISKEWVIYSLPDALWIFSFINLMLIIWNFNLTKQSSVWILIAPIIGIASEIGQGIKIIPGTFDIVDLVFLTAFATLSFIPVLVSKFRIHEKKIFN